MTEPARGEAVLTGDGRSEPVVAEPVVAEPVLAEAAPAEKARAPLYPRLLRLRHIRPNAWQRALLGEGALALAALLVLADLATAWTLLVLPLAVAVVVKAHDLLAARLAAPDMRNGAGPEGPTP